VAACLLVKGGLTPDNAFEQIATARGLAVPDTEEQRAFVAAFARSGSVDRPGGLQQIP
jgi:hypothetical protein